MLFVQAGLHKKNPQQEPQSQADSMSSKPGPELFS